MFDLLDQENYGIVKLNHIKNSFTAKYHPDVKSLKKSELEMMEDFYETLDNYHKLTVNK